MNPFAALFFKISRRLIPRTVRMRLNKYRGPGLAARLKLGGEKNPTVLSGPFKGLRYPTYGIGSEYFPKLLGTYELELHPTFQRLANETFQDVIIVGAGEGYYVGGLARMFPSARIVCFEGDPDGQTAVSEMAVANDFSGRLDNRGFCEPGDLREVLPENGRPLLVMDVEGGERQLLDPETVPALAGTTIVVEVHDCFEPGLDELLRQRFQATHHCEDILSQPRTLDDTRGLPLSAELCPRVLPLMNEGRPAQMRWFVLTPLA
jgi:hypothetical protein